MKAFFYLFLFASTAPAFAVDQDEIKAGTPVAQLESRSSPSLFDRINANYGFLFLGPTVSHLDGNLDGRGTNMHMRNYFSVGYELTKNTELSTGIEVRQYWRPNDPRRPDRANLEARDPYLNIRQQRIIDAGTFTLAARMRYFFAVSDWSKARLKTRQDSGNGTLNPTLYPSLSLADGDLRLSCTIGAYINLPKNAPAIREDYSLEVIPTVAYRMSPKWSTRVRFDSGDMIHSTDGRWSKLNNRFTGHNVYAGVVFTPTRSLMLNPELGWGSDTFRIDQTELSLFASYNFL